MVMNESDNSSVNIYLRRFKCNWGNTSLKIYIEWMSKIFSASPDVCISFFIHKFQCSSTTPLHLTPASGWDIFYHLFSWCFTGICKQKWLARNFKNENTQMRRLEALQIRNFSKLNALIWFRWDDAFCYPKQLISGEPQRQSICTNKIRLRRTFIEFCDQTREKIAKNRVALFLAKLLKDSFERERGIYGILMNFIFPVPSFFVHSFFSTDEIYLPLSCLRLHSFRIFSIFRDCREKLKENMRKLLQSIGSKISIVIWTSVCLQREESYFRDRWSQFDFFLLIFHWLSLLLHAYECITKLFPQMGLVYYDWWIHLQHF